MTDETETIRESDDGSDEREKVDPSEQATYELRSLEALLRRARNAWRNPLFLEGILWICTTALAVVASALLFGFLFPQWSEVGPDIILLVGGAATLLGALAAAIPFWLRVPDLDEVAARLQRYNSELRSDVVAALQYARNLRDRSDAGFSAGLSLEHVRRTIRKLNEMDKSEGGMAAYLPTRPLQAPALAFAGALALVMVPWLVAPERTGEILTLDAWELTADAADEEQHRPVVGDLDLFFSYPGYAERTAQFQAFTTGNIETLIGTEVTVKTYPLVDAARYELVMSLEGGDERRRELEKESGRLQTTMLLTKPGTYHFEAVLADGTVISDGIDRRITIEPDEAPDVTITSHEAKIEVSPDEVLEFDFEVSDDFGIESVGYVHHFAGQEDSAKKVPLELPELTNTPDTVSGSFRLDLSPMNLQPKDIVVVRLEATDNNSLTGPGVGSTPEILLRVASPEDKHMQVIQAQQEVLEQLLLVLADYLEAPVGERVPNEELVYEQIVPTGLSSSEMTERLDGIRGAHGSHGAALSSMETVLGRMNDDPLMLPRDVAIFRALYDQLYKLHRDGDDLLNRLGPLAVSGRLTRVKLQEVTNHAAETEGALEKGLLRLEDLLSTQKMAAIESAAEEIRDMKERLRELLEKYRDTKDPEVKKAILREIQRLRQRMAELLSRMQNDLQKLKQDHVNMEALQQEMMESEANKLGDNLQSIEDMLEKGDIDGALEALEKMGSNLDSLTQEMDSQFGQAQPEGLNELDKKLGELMDDVNDVEQMQREVERKTNELREKQQRERQDEIEKAIERLTRKARELVEEQRSDIDRIDTSKLPAHEREGVERAKERLEKLDEMLQQRDLESARDASRGSVDDLRSLQFGLELAQRYRSQDDDDAEAMDEAAELLDDRLNPRARKIRDELDAAMERAREELGKGDPKETEALRKEQEQVEKRAEQLAEKIDEASEEFPMIGNQLEPSMKGAQEKMSEARESLGERRTQRALDQERGALEKLRQLKQSMKEALQKQGQKKKEQNREKVEIPGSKKASPEDFREEVKKGMKDERLEDYASEIERYYESLTE